MKKFVFDEQKTLLQNIDALVKYRKNIVQYVKHWYVHPDEITLSMKFPGMDLMIKMTVIAELNKKFGTNLSARGCNSDQNFSEIVREFKSQVTPIWYRDLIR
jgi:hypothetical protein